MTGSSERWAGRTLFGVARHSSFAVLCGLGLLPWSQALFGERIRICPDLCASRCSYTAWVVAPSVANAVLCWRCAACYEGPMPENESQGCDDLQKMAQRWRTCGCSAQNIQFFAASCQAHACVQVGGGSFQRQALGYRADGNHVVKPCEVELWMVICRSQFTIAATRMRGIAAATDGGVVVVQMFRPS